MVQDSDHIITINSQGKRMRGTCSHPLIPGLDADFCNVCRIWWIDQQMTERLLNRRKNRVVHED
jgi:hypothetical protein